MEYLFRHAYVQIEFKTWKIQLYIYTWLYTLRNMFKAALYLLYFYLPNIHLLFCKVTLLTGTQVFIRMDGWGGFLEIDIKPSILDINQSEGLCGKLNGIQADDLVPRHKNVHITLQRYPDDFSLSWK